MSTSGDQVDNIHCIFKRELCQAILEIKGKLLGGLAPLCYKTPKINEPLAWLVRAVQIPQKCVMFLEDRSYFSFKDYLFT